MTEDRAAQAATPDGAWQPSRLELDRRLVRRRASRRSVLIALLSTVVFAAVAGWLVVGSPNWETVQRTFFNPQIAADSFPRILEGLWLNIRVLFFATIAVAVVATLLAVMRSLRGPVFFPLRALATGYTDLFRGLPVLIVLYLVGFGIPGLNTEVRIPVAVLGTIAGILALALTVYMKFYGRASWSDVAWAIVGVIPIGKLGAFAEGGEAGTKAFLKGFVAADEFGPAIGQVRSGWTAVRTGFTAAGSGVPGLAGAGRSLFTEISGEIGGGADIFARYMGVADNVALQAATDNGVNAAHLVAGHMDVNIKTTISNVVGVFGAETPPEPPVDTWREQLAATS